MKHIRALIGGFIASLLAPFGRRSEKHGPKNFSIPSPDLVLGAPLKEHRRSRGSAYRLAKQQRRPGTRPWLNISIWAVNTHERLGE